MNIKGLIADLFGYRSRTYWSTIPVRYEMIQFLGGHYIYDKHRAEVCHFRALVPNDIVLDAVNRLNTEDRYQDTTFRSLLTWEKAFI